MVRRNALVNPTDSECSFFSRAMTHDPAKYSDPHLFKPERFLTREGRLNDDDTVLTFGFGRR
jgi:cytochrome P450